MKESTKKINTRIDLILLILFLIGSLYFLVEMILGEMIPMKYILMIGVGVFVLFLLIYLTFKWHNLFIYIIRKIILVFLCSVLIVGGVFQGQLRSAFLNVVDGSTMTDQMHVVVLKDSNYESMDDISTLGYENQANGLLTYALEKLVNETLTHVPYETQIDAYAQLDLKQVDAILVSDQEFTFEVDKKDSTYLEKYRILDTIERRITNNGMGVSSTLTEPFVVYVTGLDSLGEPTYNRLSDVNMLLMIDPNHHHVEMISINRDTYVPNAKYNDYPDKLTHLGWDGARAGADALERVFGIEIDYTVKVTFESLIKIIDALGGIDVDVLISFTEQDENRSFASENLIHLEKGYQHLDGREALAYARHRKSAGWDVMGREKAQRQIIAAVANKILSVEGAFKIGDVLNVAASYVATDMAMSDARGFVMKAIDDGKPWTFGSSTVNSHYEFPLPTASYSYADLSSVLLSTKDIQKVHDMYVSMEEEVNLNEFEFDLNNMEQYSHEFELDPKVITVENYYEVVPTYFPSYLRHRF